MGYILEPRAYVQVKQGSLTGYRAICRLVVMSIMAKELFHWFSRIETSPGRMLSIMLEYILSFYVGTVATDMAENLELVNKVAMRNAVSKNLGTMVVDLRKAYAAW